MCKSNADYITVGQNLLRIEKLTPEAAVGRKERLAHTYYVISKNVFFLSRVFCSAFFFPLIWTWLPNNCQNAINCHKNLAKPLLYIIQYFSNMLRNPQNLLISPNFPIPAVASISKTNMENWKRKVIVWLIIYEYL